MRKRKGVLTLEAAIAVPLFIFAIYFMTELMRVVSIYDTVQTNMYNTAKFINGYTYLVTATGLNEFNDSHNTETLITEVEGIFNDVIKTGTGDVDKLVDELLNTILAKGGSSAIEATVSKIASKNLTDALVTTYGEDYKSKINISDIDFSESKVNVESNGEIWLTAKYSIKIKIPIIGVNKDLELTNNVMIKNFEGAR